MHLLHSSIAERAIVHLQRKPKSTAKSAKTAFSEDFESR